MTQLTLQCGAIYVGRVEYGQPYGKGKVITSMILPNGDKYIGELYNGQPDQIGIVTYFNEFSYEGIFDEGRAWFGGVVRDNLGRLLSGYHTCDYCDIDHVPIQYFGNFIGGKRSGFGIIKWFDDDTDEGEFENDVLVGLIVRTTPDQQQAGFNFKNGFFESNTPFELPIDYIQKHNALQRCRLVFNMSNEMIVLKERKNKTVDVFIVAQQQSNLRKQQSSWFVLKFNQISSALLDVIEKQDRWNQ